MDIRALGYLVFFLPGVRRRKIEVEWCRQGVSIVLIK